MAERSYHHRKKRLRRAGWVWFWVALSLLFLVAVGIIAWDVYRGRSKEQSGEIITTEFVVPQDPKITIDEPTFTLGLPADWKEIRRIDQRYEFGITWQATKEKQDNRFMTIWIDRLPRDRPVNKMLPVESIGDRLRHGQISDNCAKYTVGGEIDANAALRARPEKAKWEEVEFICDLPRVFDNVVGTSSSEGINYVSVRGDKAGRHSYFFQYTDHNIHPNYQIFLEIVESFQAK